MTDFATNPRLERDLALYPLLSATYPGLTPDRLAELPHWLFDQYVEGVGRVLDRQQRMLTLAASYPHMDGEGRRLVDEFWLPPEPPPLEEERPTISREQYLANLRAFGVVFIEEDPAQNARVGPAGSVPDGLEPLSGQEHRG